jgi:hypothetical protein
MMIKSRRIVGTGLKEEIARALVGIVVLGFVALIGYGILQSFIGDSKLEKAIDGLRKEMVDRHNATIERESELLGKITELQQAQRKKTVLPALPPPVSIPAQAEESLLNPAQTQLNFQKFHSEKYNMVKK